MTDLEPGGPYSPERTAEAAETMADAVRYLNHATFAKDTDALESPADLDRMLAHLVTMTQRVPQLLAQSAAWLDAQEGAGLIDVTYGQYKGKPGFAAGDAIATLEAAAARFTEAARAVERAHQITSAISGVAREGEQS